MTGIPPYLWITLGLGAAVALLDPWPDGAQPQPNLDETDTPYDLEERLDRIERRLELFLQEPPAAPRPSSPTPRPRRRRPAPVPPSIFVPVTTPPAPSPALAAAAPPPVATPPPRRDWTWTQIDAWRMFRALAKD